MISPLPLLSLPTPSCTPLAINNISTCHSRTVAWLRGSSHTDITGSMQGQASLKEQITFCGSYKSVAIVEPSSKQWQATEHSKCIEYYSHQKLGLNMLKGICNKLVFNSVYQA